ncbi:copper-sensing transcription factor [Purpureocillium lavendulum]|uniref:Copper-sensing transcription factor n=1 Tax=Purpureocillium lavendulum TaxID=1247861 RepID=A0AB34FRW1_9HYPO|nr:copper-sensing transcription factor [Purpureocillium lavendulum]
MKNLASCSSIGDVIWFGFGIRHIVREVAQTAQGTILLTLCGTLGELHPPKACAAILMKLAEVCDMPGDLRPSPQQWINMVEVCSGILRPTTFGCVAGQFMAFSGPGAGSTGADNAEDVARALHAIALISSGALDSIRLVGGRSCGWIAAFGYFFLGIHVEIRTAGGTLCYQSVADEDEVRVFVVYDETTPSNRVQVNNKAYRIRTIDDYIHGWDSRYDSTMSGSVPWEKCITETFGASAVLLLEAKEQFGNLVSCAARVFHGLTKAEPCHHFGRLDFQTWFGFQTGQSGLGFVDSAIFWFPELASLRDYIQFDLNNSVDDAVEAYTEAAEQIVALCGCHHCHKDYAKYQGRSYCLTVLAETLIFLVWNLSGMHLAPNLKPYRSGLRFMYELHAGEAETDQKFGDRYGGSTSRDAYWGDIVHLVRLLDLASVYHTAQFLFTTNLYPQAKLSTFTAASVGGICFYLNFLREISDDPERSVVLHVLPGGIATREGRKYQYVADKMGFEADGLLGLDWRENGTFESVPEFALNYTCGRHDLLGAFASDSELANDTGSHDLAGFPRYRGVSGGLARRPLYIRLARILPRRSLSNLEGDY